mgnify:CR=1 FL=1
MSDELSNFSMLELFRLEVDNQAAILNEGLLALERGNQSAQQLEALMRAAHSVKGAARMVGNDDGVLLAHAMEDSFVAAQSGALQLGDRHVDLLLKAVDQLLAISRHEQDKAEIEHLAQRLRNPEQASDHAAPGEADAVHHRQSMPEPAQSLSAGDSAVEPAPAESAPPPLLNGNVDPELRVPGAAARADAVRVSSESLNRLVGLAGEVQVESRWLRPFAEALLQIKHRQAELVGLLDQLHDRLYATSVDEYSRALASDIQSKANRCRHSLGDQLVELDAFDRRMDGLGKRLHTEVIVSRMRPFADATRGFPRMVRDLSRQLGKRVELRIEGLRTQVDRHILEHMEAPLNHLLRNALDHGIETPPATVIVSPHRCVRSDISREAALNTDAGETIRRLEEEAVELEAAGDGHEAALASAAEAHAPGRWIRMPSGAGHDASYMNQVAPTAMIFVPSIGGRSHVEFENTRWEDCEAGANVLLHCILQSAGEADED